MKLSLNNKSAASTAFFGLCLSYHVDFAMSDHQKLEWSILKTTLPKPLSDHSASLGIGDGKVYIAGGCDALDGNAYVMFNETDGGFICGSLSDSLYSFDLDTETFTELDTMPKARYRHSAVYVAAGSGEHQLWLIGGRDIDDNVIPDVDVYNIAQGTWNTFTLPEEHQISDQGSFIGQEGSFAYVAGGYTQDYTAQDTVFRIDTVKTTEEEMLAIETVAPMNAARGDITGVTADDGTYAVLGGGFTHENKFCSPLDSVERYDFDKNEWTKLPPLINARGEVVFVELNDHVLGLGGERQVENICDIVDSTDPGEHTLATTLVELWEKGRGDWTIIADFPNHKFRFAAIGLTVTETIYAFGGQTVYDSECQCFKTSDEISVLKEMEEGSSAVATAPISTLLFVLSAITGWFVLY